MTNLNKKSPLLGLVAHRLIWAVAGLLSLAFYLGIWPLVYNIVILPKVVPGKHGLQVNVFARLELKGNPSRSFFDVSDKLTLEKPNTSLLAYGLWEVPKTGHYQIHLECDDFGSLNLDGQDLIRLTGINARNIGDADVELEEGYHLMVLRLFNRPGQGWLTLNTISPQQGYSLLGGASLVYLDLANLNTWLQVVKVVQKGSELLLIFSLGAIIFLAFVHLSRSSKEIQSQGRMAASINYLKSPNRQFCLASALILIYIYEIVTKSNPYTHSNWIVLLLAFTVVMAIFHCPRWIEYVFLLIARITVNNLKNSNPIRIFLILGGIFGILFLFITPPFQVPDEYQHFFHAYNVSEGRFRAKIKNDRIGETLPSSLLEFAVSVNHDVDFHPQNKQSLQDLKAQFKKSLHPRQRQFIDFPDTARYPALAYLPQVLGISIGRLASFPPIIIFYLGRLSNLLVWLGLIALALRLIPMMSWGMVLLALAPMSLFQAASLSPDGLSNGIAFLTIAFFLYLALGSVSKVNRGQGLILLGLAFLLAFTKQVYVLLMGLFFLVPTVKFGGRKRKMGVALVLFVSGVVGLMLWYFFYSELYPQARADGLVTFAPKEQLWFILQYPMNYIHLLWATAKAEGLSWIKALIGLLGWVDTPLPALIYYTFFPALLTVVLLDKRPDVSLSFFGRLVPVGVFGVSLLAILTVLYVSWNPLRSPMAYGLQGRYLTPLSPLLILPFCRTGKRANPPSWLGTAVVLYLVSVLGLTVFTLIKRYYLA